MELGKYLDETRTLGYSQVFLQFSGTRHKEFYDDSIMFSGLGSDQRFVVEGKVVVAKNPYLHPGDVRVLRAVDVLALVVGSRRETHAAGGDATKPDPRRKGARPRPESRPNGLAVTQA
jgi:hypothetical protein